MSGLMTQQQSSSSRSAQNGAADSVPDRLVEAFARFGPLWIRYIRGGPGDDVSPTRMRALAELARAGHPMIMRALTELLGVTPRAVTSLVDALEGEGLVRRAPHPKDRRATCVELTAEGRRVVGEQWARQCGHKAEIFAELSSRDQQALLRSVEALTEVLHRRQQAR